MSVANGLMEIGSGALGLSHISDTGSQWADIRRLSSVGNRNYGSFYDLEQGYDLLASLPTHYDVRDLRGYTDGQLAGNVLNNTMAGAGAGAAFSPLGIGIGAALGLGAGLWGVAAGNKAARDEQQALTFGAESATDIARSNLSAASEGLRDDQYRHGAVHAVAAGGPIARRSLTAKEFAEKVMARSSKGRPASAIVRKKCDGGIMIRIKK